MQGLPQKRSPTTISRLSQHPVNGSCRVRGAVRAREALTVFSESHINLLALLSVTLVQRDVTDLGTPESTENLHMSKPVKTYILLT